MQSIQKTIQEFLSEDPLPSAALDDFVTAAAATMKERQQDCVLILDGSELVGIFTERDLMLRVDHSSQAWRDSPVSDVMTKEVVLVDARESLSVAVKKMQSGLFRHLPVVFGEQRPVGLVSIRDILAYIAEHFPAEFLNLPPDPELEARNQWGG